VRVRWRWPPIWSGVVAACSCSNCAAGGRSEGTRFSLGPSEARDLGGALDFLARSVPLLVIHGEGDTLVPVAHGQRIAATYGPGAHTPFVPGTEHVHAYAADPRRYLARVDAFVRGHRRGQARNTAIQADGARVLRGSQRHAPGSGFQRAKAQHA
jgi:hypothetical protein